MSEQDDYQEWPGEDERDAKLDLEYTPDATPAPGYPDRPERLVRDEDRLRPIREVWEHYRHLDVVLSDEGWMLSDNRVMSEITHKLWQAIRIAVGQT